MAKQLKILFAAGELAPLAKVGGLADVIGSLPLALVSLGVDVRIVIPKYGIIDDLKYGVKLLAKDQACEFLGKMELFNLYYAEIASSSPHQKNKVPVYLIEHTEYLSQNGIYTSSDASSDSSAEEAKRFTFFSQSILSIFTAIAWQPDLIHCHDWHVGLLPLLAKQSSQRMPTLLTIHNLAYQGDYRADLVIKMLGDGLLKNESIKTRLAHFETINYLEQGILNADLLSTVSPTYASEILTPEFGCGLEGALAQRRLHLFGILNGIDTDRFNPETDPEIKHNFHVNDLEAKAQNKKDLQEICGLRIDEKIPLISLISRLTEQKGFDILLPLLKKLSQKKLQLVFLGTGSAKYEAALKKLDKLKDVYVKIGFDAGLAQKIYAGSDMFLMPSRFEPCGLGQMISLRYGTIPIVRATGGLKDTIKEITPTGGNGFLFYPYESLALLQTIERALEIYQNGELWQAAVKRAMLTDFSWFNSAKKYIDLYHKII